MGGSGLSNPNALLQGRFGSGANVPYPNATTQAEIDANSKYMHDVFSGNYSGISNDSLQTYLDNTTQNRDTAETAVASGGTLQLGPHTTASYSASAPADLTKQIDLAQAELTKRTGIPGPASLSLSDPNIFQFGPTDQNLPAGTLPSAPLTVSNPSGGITGGSSPSGRDEASLLAEAELQKQLAEQTNTNLSGQRSKSLSDLADLLTKQQQRLMTENAPGLYEDLNTRGLLRSSELGNAVAREQAKSYASLQDTIGQQGIADRNTSINDLSGIENNYLGARSSAIQRGMSLQDWQRQIDASKALGFALQPQAPSGNGKSATGLNAAIGGATVGSKFGAGGAVAGGAAGLLAGKGK